MLFHEVTEMLGLGAGVGLHPAGTFTLWVKPTKPQESKCDFNFISTSLTPPHKFNHPSMHQEQTQEAKNLMDLERKAFILHT